MGKILSGMRPTGRLQRGNLMVALENWMHLQGAAAAEATMTLVRDRIKFA